VDPAHMRPIFVPPGTGTFLASIGVTHRLTGEQAGGSCYLFESTFEPGVGNRLHVHRDEDEIGYVLEGALEVRVEGEAKVLEAGGLARLPKGIPHAIRNPLTTSSRYLFIAVPAGLDRWFDEVARARADGTLDDARSEQLAREFGVRWLE
jgi:quercetin dioxygenase-like cupin family protein